MVQNIVSALGAGSGIDTQQLVKDLVSVERAVKDEFLDARKTKLDTQLSAYGVLRSSMATFQDSLTILTDPDTFAARAVSFPETDVLTPTLVRAEALPGEFEIEVTTLAKAHSVSSASFGDPADAVGKGTLTFQQGVWDGSFTSFTADANENAAVITIDDSNNTLEGLRDAINDADFGAQASIINDGSGYRLLITAASGANNELSITVAEDGGSPTNDDGSDLSRFAFNDTNINPFDPNTKQLTANQSGVDAQLSINGFAISRESNTLDDVITGLDFTINKEAPGQPVTISITEDKVIAEQAVRDFVSTYNEFYQTARALTLPAPDVDDDEEKVITDGSLNRDSSARTIIGQIRSVISDTVDGVSGAFVALTNLGIRTELDGSLSISEDEFTDAFESNFDEIASLFTPQRASSDALISVVKTTDSTAAGTFAVTVSTQPSKGSLPLAAAISHIDFDGVTDTFTSTFNAGAGDYSFKVIVDGTTSETITLTGAYDSAEEVRADLQSLINGDPKLNGVRAEVDVTYDAATDTFSFTSRSYGSDSKVSITEVGTDIGNLGLSLVNGTAGVDVAGTIDGKTAFGSGNILLPELSSGFSGLALEITPGATSATLTLSRGFAVEMNNVLNAFLGFNGLLDDREDSINNRLKDVTSERNELDRRMDLREIQLRNQFIAMERIIAGFQTTGSFLDGIVDRLPFTASRN